jgi:hypothetical protein
MMYGYLEKNHPEARLAMKGHGRAPWRYETVATAEQNMYCEQYGKYKLAHNHRQVLPEEVVADLDCDEGDLRENTLAIVKVLAEKGYEFSAWRTNGEEDGGVHIHSFFDIPESVSDTKLLKKILLEHLLGDYRSLGIDVQVLGNHLIRFEGGAYEKLPPWKARKKTLLYSTEQPLKKNRIPQEVWVEYAKNVLKYKLTSLRRGKKVTRKGDTPKSIKFILSDKFKEYTDGGKRALFVLASYYRKLSDEELLELLSDFNKYNLKTPLSDYQLRMTIQSVRNHKGRFVGERYRKELLRDIGAYEEVYGDEED